eukprot:6783601-Heterocapsa_arctica.AAC.1
MEQGTETGAWTSVHSTWGDLQDMQGSLEQVPMEAVKHLLGQMPHSASNQLHLQTRITSTTVAQSGP